MKKLITAFAVTTALIAGCNQQSNQVVDAPPENGDTQAFEAFLKTKRISADDQPRYDRLFKEYQRRAALADAIYDTEVLNRTLIDAEIEEFRKELLISRYFEKYLDQAVTEEGMRNFYSEHIDQYQSQKVRVSHILFRTDSRMDETERQAALTRARDAHGKIISGQDFAVIAEELSEDKVSGKKGGDLGWINQGAVSSAFSEKVFSMQAGELSEPFLSDYGFHLIKIMESPQEVTKPFETIKGDIRYQLRSESKKAEMERLLASIEAEKK